MRAFVEYQRFTLDWSGTPRILARPEYVGKELPDKILTLRRVTGVQRYMEITASYAFDRSAGLI